MKYRAGVILGHAATPSGLSSRQIKRLEKGIELFKDGRVDYLLTTGGVGRLFNYTEIPLGILCKEYLINRGIPEDKILVEKSSKNTFENAKFSLAILGVKRIKSVDIITSIDHIPRAKRIFKDVYPKDFRIRFVVSDYFSGLWTFWDFFWNLAAWGKYFLANLKFD